MAKAKFMNMVQDIPEVSCLEEIDHAGAWAVKGLNRPIAANPVTEYGMEQLSIQYPLIRFFTGKDGETYYAMPTGEFV